MTPANSSFQAKDRQWNDCYWNKDARPPKRSCRRSVGTAPPFQATSELNGGIDNPRNHRMQVCIEDYVCIRKPHLSGVTTTDLASWLNTPGTAAHSAVTWTIGFTRRSTPPLGYCRGNTYELVHALR